MSKVKLCRWCGGSCLVDGDEVKCLACGRSVVVGERLAVSSEEARKEVEVAVRAEWDDYVAERAETHSARYGAGTISDIADYRKRYHIAHREKDLADMIRWKRANEARLKEYRRNYRATSGFGVCRVCGATIHFSKKYGWRHRREARAFHLAEAM